jgi:CheY-like chemotaxis protein
MVIEKWMILTGSRESFYTLHVAATERRNTKGLLVTVHPVRETRARSRIALDVVYTSPDAEHSVRGQTTTNGAKLTNRHTALKATDRNGSESMAELSDNVESPSLSRVLIADSSENDASIVGEVLRKEWPGLVCHQVRNEAALREALKEQAWDCIVSETDACGFGVPSILETLRLHQFGSPLIVVSRDIETDQAIEFLNNGARDFVLKDNLIRLVPATRQSSF